MLRNLSVLFLAVLVSCGAQAQMTAPTLVVAHVSVIDATGAPAQSEMSVVVRDGRIVDIEKSSAARIPEHAIVVEGRGKYLIPGL
jgi:imidazolonepropionase-like amidohydrolase